MTVQELRDLLSMARTWSDDLVTEIADFPRKDQIDYMDRVIVAVAKGEREWRAEV